jgi:hypothetical protein
LLGNGDFALGFVQYDPVNGPVAGTFTARMARVGGHTGDVVWIAKFPSKADRPENAELGDFIALAASHKVVSYSKASTFAAAGAFCQGVDLGTSGSVTCPVNQTYMMGAAAGADGATLWSWGAYDWSGAVQLNPWSEQTWPLTQNPGQFSGGDGYLFGFRDNGTTIGPWFTEGDYGVLMNLIVDPEGDLVVSARSSGFVSFNGGQEFLPNGGAVLAKINHADGHIIWTTSIAVAPDQLVLAPGDRIVTVSQESGDAPYVLGIYAGNDGSFLSGFSNAGLVYHGKIACGKTEMYLGGAVSSPTDFNPGAATDTLGATPGVFVSRFSFQ